MTRPVTVARIGFAVLLLVGAVVVGVGAAGTSPATATTGARVIYWVDGDTVETSRGTVRLIGIDTPERDHCGYRAARSRAAAIAPAGSRIRLGNPTSVVNHDAYGRRLRYVISIDGRDVALAQIKHGAAARYDSRDGYQWHPREDSYRRADRYFASYDCPAGDGTAAGGSATPVDGDCPSSAPIKGNANSMIYHRPGQEYYDVTRAEECFATASQAEAAGYRASQV